MFVRVGVKQPPIRGDDVHGFDIIDAQPMRPAQPAEAAGEREAGHTSLRYQPAGRGQAEGGGLTIHIAPERASLHPGPPRRRIDPHSSGQ